MDHKIRRVDPNLWKQAVKAHDEWITRLNELPVAVTIASRPVMENNKEALKRPCFSGVDIIFKKSENRWSLRYVRKKACIHNK